MSKRRKAQCGDDDDIVVKVEQDSDSETEDDETDMDDDSDRDPDFHIDIADDQDSGSDNRYRGKRCNRKRRKLIKDENEVDLDRDSRKKLSKAERIAEKKRRRNERLKKKRQEMSEEERKKVNEKRKRRQAEQRQRKLLEKEKLQMTAEFKGESAPERKLSSKEKSEEEKQKAREFSRMNRKKKKADLAAGIISKEEFEERRRQRSFNQMVKRMTMTPEDRAKAAAYQRDYFKNKMTPEQKRRAYQRMKKYNTGENYQRRRQQEKPETRWRKLLSFRIQQKKKTLRKRLEKEGVYSEEEILQRLSSLAEEMKKEKPPPPECLSQYVPRPRKNQKQGENQNFTSTSTVASLVKIDPEIFPLAPPPKRRGRPPKKFEDIVKEVRTSTGGESSSEVRVNDNHFSSNPVSSDLKDNFPMVSSSSPTHSFSDHFDYSPAGESYHDDHHHDDPIDEDLDPETGTVTDSLKELGVYQELYQEPVIESHLCKECDSQFISEDALRTHFRLIHTAKCWKCPKCSEMLISAAEFPEHYNKFHKLVTVTGNLGSGSESTRKAEAGKNKNLRFGCMCCDKKFAKQPELFKHVEGCHPRSFWPCDRCKLLKYSEQSLAFHMKYCKPKPAKMKIDNKNCKKSNKQKILPKT